VTSCINVSAIVLQGCEAFFQKTAQTKTKKKKKKRSRKAKAKLRAGAVAPPAQSSPIPPIAIPPIDQLIPDISPTPPSTETPPAEPDQPQGKDEGQGAPPKDSTAYAQALAATLRSPSGNEMSIRDARVFLQFLLGGNA
jgi:hypothetical protein